MSLETRGRKKDKLYAVQVTESLLYGWTTFNLEDGSNISAVDLQALKILDLSGATTLPGIICIEANNPKPPKFTKQRGEEGANKLNTLTTFGAYNCTFAELLAQGWTRSSYGLSLPSGDTLRNTWVCVNLGGSNGYYGWSMSQSNFELFGADLGIEKISSLSDADKAKVFIGARLPFPAALKKISGTKAQGRGSIVFCATNKINDAINSGNWKIDSSGRTFLGIELK